ncbi:hypothetical protein N7471_000504 [Penicillium samsonianum]|uniref:uncharacterized protein n=1 Tax=Penicillium samsonianum TaxID=1882272 RepID=UPI002546DA7F|nr:uncharacterized protein N7471_000504 [Penicillium samsonianum]KAJ6149305.1 hypothetical protein N7471_000504 [Penicillium samsonianum]
MKASFIAAVAALAGSAFAAPTPTGLDSLFNGLKVGDVTKELNLKELPVVSKLGDLSKVLNLPSPASPSASGVPAVQDGHVVQNLGPQLDNILTVVGPDATTLLIELSPEVSALVTGLGLGALGVPLGSIVASASSVGGLVTGLGPVVDGLVIVVGADVGALLISLSPEVAGLLSGLGLPTVGIPVGTVVATLGKNLKRGEIVQDLAPKVKTTLTVTGKNAKNLLVELSPSVTSLVAGLGLTTIAGPIGSIVAEASSVGDLVVDISEPVENLLHIVGKDGKHLLIKLSPSVVALVTGLGLPTVATPVGAILTTVAMNL